MPKYNVTKHEENGDIVTYTVSAANLAEAKDLVLEDLEVVVELVPEADLSWYYQRSTRYAGMKIGASNLSFQNYGCFIHCLSFLTKKDPIIVMKLLAEKGGINKDGLVVSQKAAEILGLDLLKGDDPVIPGKVNDINFMPKFNTVKEVLLGRGQHFVVRLIDENGKRSIFDPWTGKIQAVNFYPFRSYRLFKVK